MKVISLATRRTSKIFWRPIPRWLCPSSFAPPDHRIHRIPFRICPCSSGLRCPCTARFRVCKDSVGPDCCQSSRMMIRIVDQFGILQALFGHDGRMPVRSPALIHDLCNTLRREIVAFVPDDGEQTFCQFSIGALSMRNSMMSFSGCSGKFLDSWTFLSFKHFHLLFNKFRRINEFIHVMFGSQFQMNLSVVILFFVPRRAEWEHAF